MQSIHARIKYHAAASVVRATRLVEIPVSPGKLDNIPSPYMGLPILFTVLFLFVSKSVFWVASYPMDGIEWIFRQLASWFGGIMPENWFTIVLFINGWMAGLAEYLSCAPGS